MDGQLPGDRSLGVGTGVRGAHGRTQERFRRHLVVGVLHLYHLHSAACEDESGGVEWSSAVHHTCGHHLADKPGRQVPLETGKRGLITECLTLCYSWLT